MNTLSILNNPAKDHLLVKIEGQKTQPIEYVIADMEGHEICAGRYPANASILPIGVDFLKRGMYLLLVVTETAYGLQTFIKI
ncbi:MAG: hypothetical protein IPK46_11440 [Saprospiraceae bacterium]|nr:hypothetical protein [Saprospiraceae bacterium]